MKINKHWKLRQDYEIETVDKLAEALGVDHVIAMLLVERGITTFEEARSFFRPSLDQIHNPFLMKDMDLAIQRIEQALEDGERILVYGDYDVDGISAVAVVYSYLMAFYDNIDFYIPDRDTEGYGISYQGIDYAHETGVKLIIALDCGIKAMEQVDYATERGIDFIIGDHHLPADVLPAAVAVLDPKRDDCPYPYKELSGCGIGFKIVEAHLEKQVGVSLSSDPAKLTPEENDIREQIKPILLKYLDLVALSIASDIVPVMGENRVLATYGLRVINSHPRPGIEALLSYGHVERRNESERAAHPNIKNYFSKELSLSDLVFLVGPRLNAAGRLHSAADSVRLLLCDNHDDAREIAQSIDKLNQDRKEFDSEATRTAKERYESNPQMMAKKSIVLFDEGWHKGVVGIVASRMVEAYYKPTIIFTLSADDLVVGSARSFKEFDVHTALEQCADLLEHFGGHRCAAGVSLKKENFKAFIDRFEEVVAQSMPAEGYTPEIEIDAEISFSRQINAKFMRIIKQFAPFGPENTMPVFLSHGLVDTGTPAPRIVGANHLKFTVISHVDRSRAYPAIAFQQGEYYEPISRGAVFSLCYTLEENCWKDRVEMQLNVKDIKISSDYSL